MPLGCGVFFYPQSGDSSCWLDFATTRSLQAAGLLARLLSLPDRCLAAEIARHACARLSSSVNNVMSEPALPEQL